MSSTTSSAPFVSAVSEQSANQRRFAMLKRSGIFSGDLKGCCVQRACSAEDLASAYRLVHEVFVAQGFMKPEPAEMRMRIYETLTDTATFIAKHNGSVVAVLSIVGDTPALGLPSDSAFKAELDERRAAGFRLFEITNQAVAEEYRRSAIATELMRCAVAHALHVGYDCGIATVSPSHRGFYSMIGFEEIGSERSYSEKVYDPVIALSMDLDPYREQAKGNDALLNFVHHELTAGNRYCPQIAAWCREARQAFLNAEFLVNLFVARRNFLAECTVEQSTFLQAHWGINLFSQAKAESDEIVISEKAAEALIYVSAGDQAVNRCFPAKDSAPRFSTLSPFERVTHRRKLRSHFPRNLDRENLALKRWKTSEELSPFPTEAIGDG